jgi:hypothetical protein
MVRFIIAMAIAFTLVSLSYGQGKAVPDWIKNLPTVEVTPEPEVTPTPTPAEDYPPSVLPVSPLDGVLEEMQSVIADAKQATKRANDAAEKAEVATKIMRSMQKVGDWQDDADRLTKLEEAVAELKSRKQWSEDEIRVIAKDEAEKLIKATVKMPDGTTKEVGADSIQVSVNGYSGTFSVPKGGRIVAVDGRPVGGVTMMSNADNPQEPVQFAVTDSVQLQSVPRQQGIVRFWSLPSRAASANKTCRQVWNPATRRYEQRCN